MHASSSQTNVCSSSVKIGFKIMCPISMQFATMPADMRFIKSLAELNISGNKWVTTVRGRLASDENLFLFFRFSTFDSGTFEDLTALESLYAEHMGTLTYIGDSALGTMPMLKTLSLR